MVAKKSRLFFSQSHMASNKFGIKACPSEPKIVWLGHIHNKYLFLFSSSRTYFNDLSYKFGIVDTQILVLTSSYLIIVKGSGLLPLISIHHELWNIDNI